MYAATELCHVSLIQSEHTHALQFISVKLLDWKIGFSDRKGSLLLLLYGIDSSNFVKTFERKNMFCLLSEYKIRMSSFRIHQISIFLLFGKKSSTAGHTEGLRLFLPSSLFSSKKSEEVRNNLAFR